MSKFRLENNLTQSQIAKKFNVRIDTITFWELNKSKPTPNITNRIMELIGYNPLIKESMTLGEKLKSKRLEMGLTYEVLSNILKCDESNLRLIELKLRNPNKTLYSNILELLNS